MWKEISKFNYGRFINFCIHNKIVLYSNKISETSYKSEYVLSLYCKVNSELDSVELPLFREVKYFSGRVTYFCNNPFIEWFKYYFT